MSDQEIIAALKALDQRDDIELTSWECGFMESMFRIGRLSPKQREVAIGILEEHEHRGGGDQETIVRGPSEVMRHLRSTPPPR